MAQEIIRIRHHDIADLDIGPFLIKAFEVLAPVGSEDDFVSHSAQKGAVVLADQLIVVNQEDLDLAFLGDGGTCVSLFGIRFSLMFTAQYIGATIGRLSKANERPP